MIKVFNKFMVKLKQKKVAKIKAKQQEAFKKSMNDVYNTLKWIEKNLPNRKLRKQFYSDILHKGFIHSKYLNMFMGKFINRDEVVLSAKEYRDLRVAAGVDR